MPNVNFGFTYNKVASFNRKFKGSVPGLKTSMSNYIAGICNSYNLTADDVTETSTYNPFYPGAGSKTIPWIAIMGYESYLTDPDALKDGTQWYGQYGDGTSGTGGFSVTEKGSIDEYNIALGGNINNFLYWGMDFGITSIDYRISSVWGESLENAYVYNPNASRTEQCTSQWAMYDNYKVSGTGFNFKLGFILKPIQEFRIGLAFHTPTYYNLTEYYTDSHIDFNYPFTTGYSYADYCDPYDFSFRTPWRVIASMAGVIANRLIVSADYEWNSTNGMRFGDAKDYGYYDPWYDWDYPYWSQAKSGARDWTPAQSDNDIANSAIKNIYKDTNTIRLGAEFRVVPSFSIRAGYSWSSSPIKSEVKNGEVYVPGTGLMSNYTLDNQTSYITCGLGYKNKGFYADLAYVYKHQESEYFPYSPDLYEPQTAAKSKLTFNKSQIALSIGFKF